MQKKTLLTILKVFEIVTVTIIIICFFVRFALIISSSPNYITLVSENQFETYSYLDGFIKLNLVFVATAFIFSLILKRRSLEHNKKNLIILLVMLAFFVTTNVAHLITYCIGYYTDSDYSCTDYEDYIPIPKEYEKYFPYFDKFKELTTTDVLYDYRYTSTHIGEYIYMNTACSDTGIYFNYEEIKTTSKLLMTQFLATKGEPTAINTEYENTTIEPVFIENYNCMLYKYEDFYEIWFVEDERCVIIQYANFNDLMEISEASILEDAKNLYIQDNYGTAD